MAGKIVHWNGLSTWCCWILLVYTASSSTASDVSADDNTNNNWKWRPEVPHPCTIQRMNVDEYRETFEETNGIPVMYPHPLVLRTGRERNDPLRQVTTEDKILSAFPPGFNVTLSSSNSFSQHRRTIPLAQYLEELRENDGTTSPTQLSNTSWYLFGETFSDDWKKLLTSYQLPPCQSCQHEYSALSFGIGNRGSGVQWHIHGPGFGEALHGRKHWILYPPHYQPPFFHPDQSTRNWMEYIYTNTTKLANHYSDYYNNQQQQQQLGSNDDEKIYPVLDNGLPYECTLEPGDLIYFPDRWHHATLNCNPYTAFVSTFTSDHLYLQDYKRVKRSSSTFGSEL